MIFFFFSFLFHFILAAEESSYPVDEFGRKVVLDMPPLDIRNQKSPLALEYADACAKHDVQTDWQKVDIVSGDLSRYKLGKRIGTGTYSIVYMAKDLKTGKVVVVKFLTKSNLSMLLPREILMLSQVYAIPDAIMLLDVITNESLKQKPPALVFPLLKPDNHHDLYPQLTLTDIQEYVGRMLKVLDTAHSNCIIHGDIKPLNVLIEHDQRKISVVDWGLSVHYVPDGTRSYHSGTRHWKAPELLLGFRDFTYAVDIWAVGVMFLEMLVGRVHVFPTDNTHEQAALLARFVGKPKFDAFCKKYGIKPKAHWLEEKVWRKYRISEKDNKFYTFSMGSPGRLEPMIRAGKHIDVNACGPAIDLIKKMLVFDPELRITASKALRHPFFAQTAPSALIANSQRLGVPKLPPMSRNGLPIAQKQPISDKNAGHPQGWSALNQARHDDELRRPGDVAAQRKF